MKSWCRSTKFEFGTIFVHLFFLFQHNFCVPVLCASLVLVLRSPASQTPQINVHKARNLDPRKQIPSRPTHDEVIMQTITPPEFKSKRIGNL